MTESIFDKYQGRQPIIDEAAEAVNHDQFHEKAKALVADVFNRNYDNRGSASISGTPKDFYVVWFCKVLGNWKAMVSTDLTSGVYYEVTYDGNKEQTYIDSYIKSLNTCVTDAGYASAHLS